MRKVSCLSRKIEQFLNKAVSLHGRGRLKALNFEIAGIRFAGKDLKEVSFEDGIISFCLDEKKMSVSLEQIKKFKRLRTQKYLFFVEGELKTPKKKKKEQPKVVVEEQPTEEDKE